MAVQLLLVTWALFCTIGMLVGAARLQGDPRRIFTILGVSGFLVSIGAVVRTAIAQELPLPSYADLLTLPGYLAFFFVMVMVLKARAQKRNIDAWLDATAITSGAFLLYWVGFLAEFMSNPNNPLNTVALSTVYNVIVFGAGAVLLRIGATPGQRPMSYKLLGVAGVSFVIADIAGAISAANGDGILITLALSPIVYGLAFAATWHPSAGEIVRPPDVAEDRLSNFRLIASSLALIVPLFIAGAPAARDGMGQIVALILATIITAALILRLTRLLRSQQDLFDLKVEREATERANVSIAQNERRFRALVQNATDVVLVLDASGVPSYVSPAIETITGYPVSAYLGRSLEWTTHRNDWDDILHSFRQVLKHGESQRVEIRTMTSSNETRLLSCVTTNMMNVDGVGGIVVNATDITSERLLESDLRTAELFDPLTLLFNRNTFIGEVSRAIRENSFTQTETAVAVINLDEFRILNEGIGTEVGDEVLIETAARIRRHLRIGDVVARLNGDEFGVLMTVEHDPEQITEPIDRILTGIAKPMTIGGHDLTIRATAGLAIDSDGSLTGVQLMRNADTAVDAAKESQRGGVLLFEEQMGTEVSRQIEIRNRLRHAIVNEELRLVYQPLIDIGTGRIASLEALARWNDPKLGEISPAIFIPVAERTGLIVEFGAWALRTVCEQISKWDAAGLRAFSVSVNLSGDQLRDPAITTMVASAITDAGIDPERLTIEITESILIDDDEIISKRIQEIRQLGVKLAIDDFGTGYSSLNYLRRYEFDILKIDRDFVTPLADPKNRRERHIAKAMIGLAHALDAITVAEGIEEVSELNALAALGCDHAQGFFFYRPTEVAEVAEVLWRSASVRHQQLAS